LEELEVNLKTIQEEKKEAELCQLADIEAMITRNEDEELIT
jgi:hypothetical protein